MYVLHACNRTSGFNSGNKYTCLECVRKLRVLDFLSNLLMYNHLTRIHTALRLHHTLHVYVVYIYI